MRRTPLIILCSVNALIALILLIVSAPKLLNSGAKGRNVQATNPTPAYTDEALWDQALNASSTREAMHVLNQIQDSDYLSETITEQLARFNHAPEPRHSLQTIQVYNAMLSIAAQKANSIEDLTGINAVFQNNRQPISVRETALRSLIETSLRLNASPAAADLDTSYAHIDTAYAETGNSLSGLALQADWFLERNAALPTARSELLQKRLNQTLLQSNGLECNRLAALQILQAAPDKYDSGNDALYHIYAETHSDQVKAGILNLLIAQKNNAALPWIESLSVSTPLLEQLQLSALESIRQE